MADGFVIGVGRFVQIMMQRQGPKIIKQKSEIYIILEKIICIVDNEMQVKEEKR